MTKRAKHHEPDLLTVAEAARLLRVSQAHVYRHIHEGDWPSPVIRIGGAIRTLRAPLDDIVKHGNYSGAHHPPADAISDATALE